MHPDPDDQPVQMVLAMYNHVRKITARKDTNKNVRDDLKSQRPALPALGAPSAPLQLGGLNSQQGKHQSGLGVRGVGKILQAAADMGISQQQALMLGIQMHGGAGLRPPSQPGARRRPSPPAPAASFWIEEVGEGEADAEEAPLAGQLSAVRRTQSSASADAASTAPSA